MTAMETIQLLINSLFMVAKILNETKLDENGCYGNIVSNFGALRP